MKPLKQIISILPLFLLGISTNAATFSDLSQNHPYYSSITFLQEQGIINGHPDNTFRPEDAINRAEMLKIAFLSINKNLPPTPINHPFSDVEKNSWYEPYINLSYQEGIVEGYLDKTFRPSKAVTKAEAIKIIAEVQKWNIQENLTSPFLDVTPNDWYHRYISTAFSQNYLEKNNLNFSPNTPITRGEISEILAQTLYQNGVTENQINTNSYDQITLESPLPTTFYLHETYQIKGQTTANTNYVTAFITKTDQAAEEFHTVTAPVINGHFTINLNFNQKGPLKLGIIPSTSGKSKVYNINVLSNLSHSNTTIDNNLDNFHISFQNDQTTVHFPSTENQITKINFTQNSKTISYLTRQNTNQITIDYRDFSQFQEGVVSYNIEKIPTTKASPLQISQHGTSSNQKHFTATTHTFSENKNDQIQITNLPEILNSPQKIIITGSSKTYIDTTVFITLPNGQVITSYLDTDAQLTHRNSKLVIPPNSQFSFEYTPTQNGTYIIEFNNQDGLPALNHPIYIGNNITPLIPDFLDLTNNYLQKDPINIENAKTELLKLINNERQKLGLNPVTTTPELNTLAQNHANDMASKNYFSHINQKGESPDQRRINQNISQPVSENLAFDTTVKNAHYRLMRSGSHRKNILTPEWEVVGLGIAPNHENQLYVVQEFSTLPLSNEQLSNLTNQLLSKFNQFRSENLLSQFSLNQNLNNAAQTFNQIAIENNGDLTQDDFQTIVEQYDINGNTTAIGGSAKTFQELENSIFSNETEKLKNSKLQNIGINIALTNNNEISIIVIFN